jgi:hypothetical protein
MDDPQELADTPQPNSDDDMSNLTPFPKADPGGM